MAGNISRSSLLTPLVSSLVQADSQDLPSLAARLVETMARCWRQGERPLAEDFLTLYPELWDEPEAALDLLYEEICLRQEHGEEQASQAVLARFPQWRAELEVLLRCHHMLEPSRTAPRFPEAGETLGDFFLLAELGRGGQGRVFLATQPELADRPVVVKLTSCQGREHLSLARLVHTHIVPLYSVQDDAERNLRILCMPYVGGTTLAHLLEALRSLPPGSWGGQQLLDVLDREGAGRPVAVSTRGPLRPYLARLSAAQAVCWLGAALAEALQYAHERGLVHLDLKPSNVLLAADGQPMLLDFHLAREPVPAQGPPPDWLGGTPAYMSPEQKAAVSAMQRGRKVPALVDGRSDIYSLGLLLYETLGGPLPLPEGQKPARLLCRLPHVSRGLADIVGKCLESDPDRRYPTAAALAVDLRRHLQDLPLQGVHNRSPVERWQKWRRRHPHHLRFIQLSLTALVATGLAAVLALGYWLDDQHTRTRQRTEELHQLTDGIRMLYGTDRVPAGDTALLETNCRQVWERRAFLLTHLGSESPAERESVRGDLLDLAILWPDLRVRRSGATEVEEARREALEVLDQAEALLGPSVVLYRQREQLARALAPTSPRYGELAEAAARKMRECTPRNAWEHYALGRSLLQSAGPRNGELDGAARQFQAALRREPRSLWPRFYQGVCAYRRGLYEDAVLAFTACVALAPEGQRAGCLYNRARSYAAWDRNDRALADYNEALELDPGLAPAALNRGILHYRAHRYEQALSDLDRALELKANPAVVHFNRALVHLARGDRDSARASVELALAADPRHKESRELRDHLRHQP